MTARARIESPLGVLPLRPSQFLLIEIGVMAGLITLVVWLAMTDRLYLAGIVGVATILCHGFVGVVTTVVVLDENGTDGENSGWSN